MSVETTSSNIVDVEQILTQANSKYKSIAVEKEDDLQYDLGNLAAFDTHPIPKATQDTNFDDTLKEYTRDNVQLLFHKVFNLPTKEVDVGVLALLPAPTTSLPREKPVPVPKALTTWEKFAIEKGIKKTKRSKKVWDELHEEWKPRFGYNRANNEKDNWAVEAGPNDDPNTDPFTQKRAQTREAMQKQKERELKNRERAAAAQKSTAPLLGSTLDLSKRSDRLTYKDQVSRRLDTAYFSTASLGKFDRLLPGQKEKPQQKGVRKLTSLPQDVATERSSGNKILDKMFGKEDLLDVQKATSKFMADELVQRAKRNSELAPVTSNDLKRHKKAPPKSEKGEKKKSRRKPGAKTNRKEVPLGREGRTKKKGSTIKGIWRRG
eukprot:TRINITY_DN7932_c0_g1_i1.p1 TRINITY_DN7932_c0_g1~~TRINITY_DN7932_c0_g1_i1.p1  ORF type:complete len:378 (+),score=110.65 TRINITY_DN7932_c0_g1_i1:177-1310(+)